jgi:hypothetical protein
VTIDLGVGFEPALGLMPLLTLSPDPLLIRDPASIGRDDETFAFESAHEGPAVARRVVAFIEEHASSFAASFADGPTIARWMERAIERSANDSGPQPPSDAIIIGPPDDPRQEWTESLLTVLCAMGRREEAIAILPAYEEHYATEPDAVAERRFSRQLRRRLDDLPSPIPPVEQTIALLPRRPKSEMPSLVDNWRRTRAERAAVDVVRAHADGRSPAELRDILAAAYAQRGIAKSRTSVALAIDGMALSQQPFGRVEGAFRLLSALRSTVADIGNAFRGELSGPPSWLRPPERAGYLVSCSSKRATDVNVDPAAHAWLERVRAESHWPLGLAITPMWLTRHNDGTVVAHIGERAIGTVSPHDAAPFIDYFHAAASFDEDLAVRGAVYRTSDGLFMADVWLPEPSGDDDHSPAESSR